MKKIIISLILLLALVSNNTTFWSQNVIVSAVVWSINQAPLVVSVNPSSNPRILWTNKTQSYSVWFSDNEKDTIYYTITPKDGYTNPVSWVINPSDYDVNWNAYVNFLYLSPASAPSWWFTDITVTLNDGPNVVVKTLNLYIY